MNYDFSNHTSSKKNASKKNSSGHIPGWLWMFIGLLIGGLMMFMLSPSNNEAGLTEEEFLIEPTNDAQTNTSNTVTEDTKSNTVTNGTQTVSGEKEAKKPTKFEFYTILSEQEVMVQELQRPSKKPNKTANKSTQQASAAPKTKPTSASKNTSTTTTISTKSATPTASTPSSNQYRLQAGSFQKQTEAKRLTDKIRTQGLNVSIEKSLIERNNVSQTWHRVMIGPFSSSDDVLDAEANLAKQGIKTLLIKRK